MDQTNLTSKQLEILLLLYRYRFLNRTHLQKFLNHKGPRRINSWLKDLTSQNIIGRKYSRKLKENTKPAIYHLATGSRKILLDHEETDAKTLKRVYREKTRSKQFIDHCLLVADIFFFLKEKARQQDVKLHFFTKVDLKHHYYLPYNRPDAYIALESENDTRRYFLEIIDEGTPRFMIRKKITQYIEYFDEETWQKRTGHPNPSILIVCPNEPIKQFLDKHIRQVLDEEAEDELYFYLGLKEAFSYAEPDLQMWTLVE